MFLKFNVNVTKLGKINPITLGNNFNPNANVMQKFRYSIKQFSFTKLIDKIWIFIHVVQQNSIKCFIHKIKLKF